MPLDIVVGTQWGDEGKGRIVDLLAAKSSLVARYNGGDNAGHTVTIGQQTFKLHLLPSGMIHPHTMGVLGAGMVINPLALIQEIEMLRAAGVPVDPSRLRLSYAAHLITPAHRALDVAQERQRGASQIGTTGRGIGPAYTDKAARTGLRLMDLFDEVAFEQKLSDHIRQANHRLRALFEAEPLDVNVVVPEYMSFVRQLRPYIGDVSDLVENELNQGHSVLAEGAQGTLLDLDHGTYPFVTSSYPIAAGALVSLGVGANRVGRVIGVTKAFQTRVGAGPFPTEVFGETAERLRGTGSNPWDEFGTTTGRPRRVGWLDGVLLRYSARINGLTELVVTKLDVLSGLPVIRVCTAYRSSGKEYKTLPLGPSDLMPFNPVYEEKPGWQADLRDARSVEDLPAEARQYLNYIETLCGIPVRQVSVGPERHQIVDL